MRCKCSHFFSFFFTQTRSNKERYSLFLASKLKEEHIIGWNRGCVLFVFLRGSCLTAVWITAISFRRTAFGPWPILFVGVCVCVYVQLIFHRALLSPPLHMRLSLQTACFRCFFSFFLSDLIHVFEKVLVRIL